MTTCPACQRDVPEERKDCPYCGVVFAKWKGRVVTQSEVPALPSNAANETIEKDEPDFFPLPTLTQKQRGDLIKIYEYNSDRNANWEQLAQSQHHFLQQAGIYAEVRTRRDNQWYNIGFGSDFFSSVYVPRQQLLPAMIFKKVRATTLAQLRNEPMAMKQKYLEDAMVAAAETVGFFKHSLFPHQALVWYQSNAGMSDEAVKSALAKATQAYRAERTTQLFWFFAIGSVCLVIGWLGRKSEGAFEYTILFFGIGFVLFGLWQTIELLRSEKK